MDVENDKGENAAVTITQDPSSDYILVTNISNHAAAQASFRERYGTHVLIWLCIASCLWGAVLIIVVGGMKMFPEMIHAGDATLDAALVICIPFFTLWSTASMWAAYRRKHYRLAMVLSVIPFVLIIWICISMGI